MKFRQQVAVGGAILNQQKELLFVRRIKDDEFMPGQWELPGGGTEYGEKPEVGLQREVREECGIEIKVSVPITVSDYYIERNNERVHRVEIVYLCELLSHPDSVQLSDEHDAFCWKPANQVAELQMSDYMSAIMERVSSYINGDQDEGLQT